MYKVLVKAVRKNTHLVSTTLLCFTWLSQRKRIPYCKDSYPPLRCLPGCYQQQTVIETACFLGTYEIPRDYMIRSARLYHSQNTFRFPEKIIMKLYIV